MAVDSRALAGEKRSLTMRLGKMVSEANSGTNLGFRTDIVRNDPEYQGIVARIKVIDKSLGSQRPVVSAIDKYPPLPAVELPRQRSAESANLESIGAWALGEIYGRSGKHEWQSRAMDPLILRAAVSHGTSADGTSGNPIEPQLTALIDATRYAVAGGTLLTLPDSGEDRFRVPKVTTFNAGEAQVSEGAALVNAGNNRFQLGSDTVMKQAYYAQQIMSEQEIDFTTPEQMGAVWADLARAYAISTSVAFCNAIVTAALDSAETVLSLTASLPDFVAAITAAKVQAYSTAKRRPDRLWLGEGRLYAYEGLTTSTGAPAFTRNADGDLIILGLTAVADPQFPDTFAAVGCSSLAIAWEATGKGPVSLAVPPSLEITMTYRNFFSQLVYSEGLALLDVV